MGDFSGSVVYDDSRAWPLRAAALQSPGELLVRDGAGRVTGIVAGRPANEIPDSWYDYHRNEVVIAFPQEPLTYEVVGTDVGQYGLSIEWVEEGQSAAFEALAIPTTDGAVHQYEVDWDALARGEDGVSVQVDNDGDSSFELSLSTGPELHGSLIRRASASLPQAGPAPWVFLIIGAVLAGGSVAVIALRRRRLRLRTKEGGER